MSAPFEIAPLPGDGGGRVASNGAARMTVLEADARLFKRRAMRVNTAKPPAETVLPLLNQLAGDLVADLSFDGAQLRERLAQIAGAIADPAPSTVEWSVAELNGVRVYFDGADVVVTTRDLYP